MAAIVLFAAMGRSYKGSNCVKVIEQYSVRYDARPRIHCPNQ